MTENLLDLCGIDAVLSRFRKRGQPAVASGPALPFEAGHPTVLAADAMGSLQTRFEVIAERLAVDLGAILRTGTSVKVASVEQVRLGTLHDLLPQQLALFPFNVTELAQPGWAVMDGITATSIIDKLVGGVGESSEQNWGLSSIEERVLGDLVGPFIAVHQEVLSGITRLTLARQDAIASRDRLGPLNQTDLYLSATYDIQTQDGLKWSLQFALPVGNLIDAVENAAGVPIAPKEELSQRRSALESKLQGVQVSTHVEVGSSDVFLSDVMELAEGDVVLLNRKPSDSLDLFVEGKLKYRGVLGQIDGRLGFKVTSVWQMSTPHNK